MIAALTWPEAFALFGIAFCVGGCIAVLERGWPQWRKRDDRPKGGRK